MTSFSKCAGAIAVASLLALSAATPSNAEGWRTGAAAAGGFVAGAAIGAAAANTNNYYYGGPGYGYYGPGYAYDPGYVYYSDYAYSPQPQVIVGPQYPVTGRCWKSTDDSRGFGYYGSCNTPTHRVGSRHLNR